MPQSVEVDHGRGIILIRSTGEVTFEDVAATADKLRTILMEDGPARALFDAREQLTAPTTTEIYQLASSMPRELRIALLPGENTSIREAMQFGETVARNSGLQWALFDDEDQAVAWLNEQGPWREA